LEKYDVLPVNCVEIIETVLFLEIFFKKLKTEAKLKTAKILKGNLPVLSNF
jgi:hypothetical protein